MENEWIIILACGIPAAIIIIVCFAILIRSALDEESFIEKWQRKNRNENRKQFEENDKRLANYKAHLKEKNERTHYRMTLRRLMKSVEIASYERCDNAYECALEYGDKGGESSLIAFEENEIDLKVHWNSEFEKAELLDYPLAVILAILKKAKESGELDKIKY